MSHTLTLELPDNVYQAVRQAAEANGQSPAELASAKLGQMFPPAEQPAPHPPIDPWIYDLLKSRAARTGRDVEELAARWIARFAPKPRPQLTEEERKAAMDELLKHAGAASLGYATGADNESIDADLAREYASTHEES